MNLGHNMKNVFEPCIVYIFTDFLFRGGEGIFPDDTIDGDTEELVGDGVHCHDGEILGECSQCVVICLGDTIGAVKYLQRPRHGLVCVEVGVEKIKNLCVARLINNPGKYQKYFGTVLSFIISPEHHIAQILWSSYR